MREREEAIREMLARISRQGYGGQPFPPEDGGLIFREVSACTGLREDRISAVAREAGLWPHSFRDLEGAFGERNQPIAQAGRFVREVLDSEQQ